MNKTLKKLGISAALTLITLLTYRLVLWGIEYEPGELSKIIALGFLMFEFVVSFILMVVKEEVDV